MIQAEEIAGAKALRSVTNWQKSKTRAEGDSIGRNSGYRLFQPMWTLNVMLRSLDFIL